MKSCAGEPRKTTSARIRAHSQRAGAPVSAICAQIIRELPLSPLEAWRLAYGWSRRHVVEAIAELYRADGLAAPGLTTAMLCRWEHGQAHPGPDHIHALARLYGTAPTRIGFALPGVAAGWYGQIPRPRQESQMSADYPELSAVAESIGLHGSDAGADLAENALAFYEARYSQFPPRVLTGEVARCRSLLLGQQEADTRRVLGWLSALLGNLAHHTGDPAGALIHLGTAARIGAQVGDARLCGWALSAQSMVTMAQDRPAEALALADEAARYATTPLRRAQVTSWCRLRPLAALGDTAGLAQSTLQARRDMDTAEDVPGRFGFDRAEFTLHLAEAHLAHDAAAAGDHATASAGLKRAGSPGWAAALAVHARAEAAQHRTEDAVGLAEHLLETVPAESLRANTVARLHSLTRDLSGQPAARDLAERVRALD